MKRVSILSITVLGIAIALTGCIGDELDPPERSSDRKEILAPSGYGNYCSMSWFGGGWAFSWDERADGDPCGYLRDEFGSSGKIERAGMYSTRDRNNVVARCAPNTVYNYGGNGDGPMRAAFDSASGNSFCVFTVAPGRLPLFDAPFAPNKNVGHGTGFDFARDIYGTVLGSTLVNHRGQDRSAASLNYINDHDAHDWNMPRGTPIYATASGAVRDARWLWTGCSGSDSSIQGEVYLTHTVSRNPSTYNETFVSSYFHLEDIVVAPNQWVNRGDLIGYSGNMGCSSGPHLHFATMRLSNTARHYRDTLNITNKGNDGYRIVIDPYGFDSGEVFDPWSWRAYTPTTTWPGGGALSINLWRDGEAPVLGSWLRFFRLPWK